MTPFPHVNPLSRYYWTAETGLPLRWDEFSGQMVYWNPLTDDGDAFRLAVKLDIDVLFMSDDEGRFTSAEGRYYAYAQHNGDPLAATRLAIVRAAAEIGKAMP